MPKISPAMWQYNGLVLLAGYLQRLYVQDEVLRLTRCAGNADRVAALPALLDAVTAAMNGTESPMLTPQQHRSIQAMLPKVERWYQATWPRPRYETRLEERVAAVSGTVCGEARVNDGLIAMGRRFDRQMAERFAQQALFHQGRIRMIAAVVGHLARGTSLPRPELGHVERWYDELFLHREGVLQDLTAIGRMLGGQSPAVRTA